MTELNRRIQIPDRKTVMDKTQLQNTQIELETEDGEKQSFFVLEETRVSGISYLLVADSEEDEANAFILKDLSEDGESTARYVIVCACVSISVCRSN